MNNLDSYVQDLMVLFNLDLLNKFMQIDNSVVLTMGNGSKVKILVKKLSNK